MTIRKLLKENILLSLCLIVFLFLIAKQCSYYISDFRIAEVQGTDAIYTAQALLEGIRNNSLNFVPIYGHVYFNINLFIVDVLRIFLPLREGTILLAQSIATTSALLLSILLMAMLLRMRTQKELEVLGVLLYMFSRDIIKFTIYAHPDNLQIVMVILSFIYLFLFTRNKQSIDVILSMLFAGLATSIKISGLFIVPSIIYVFILQHSSMNSSYREEIRKRLDLKIVLAVFSVYFICYGTHICSNLFEGIFIVMSNSVNLIATGIFLGGCIVVFYLISHRNMLVSLAKLMFCYLFGIFLFNPLLLLNFSYWIENLLKVATVSTYRYSLIQGFHWLTIFSSSLYLTVPIMVLFIILLIQYIKNDFRDVYDNACLLFIALYMSMLIFLQNGFAVTYTHYVMPIFPIAILFIMHRLNESSWYTNEKIKKSILILFFLAVILKTPDAYNLLCQKNPARGNPYYTSGALLQTSNIPTDAKILSSHYLYIPPQYREAKMTFNQNEELMKNNTMSYYDIIVVKQSADPNSPLQELIHNTLFVKRYTKISENNNIIIYQRRK